MIERDREAGVPALIGSDLQRPGGAGAVDAGSVETIVGKMDLMGEHGQGSRAAS